MRLLAYESQALILQELHCASTVAYFRTGVKDALTLLVKSQQCNFHCYQGAFHRGKVPIFLSFKDGMSKLFPTNL